MIYVEAGALRGSAMKMDGGADGSLHRRCLGELRTVLLQVDEDLFIQQKNSIDFDAKETESGSTSRHIVQSICWKVVHL